MESARPNKIVWLSCSFDDHYAKLRGEEIHTILSVPRRRDIMRCMEMATKREVVVVSIPSKALSRRRPKWLPGLETVFSGHRQFVAPNWDVPKIRIPLGVFFFIYEALKHTRRGDWVVLDNFEFRNVMAAWFLRIFRSARILVDYLDGKPLIQRSWERLLSIVAESWGRPLLDAAFFVCPVLETRLPASLPKMMVPGFVAPGNTAKKKRAPGTVHFLYSGTLDPPRGIDLMLDALPLLPPDGWRLHITGTGPLQHMVMEAAQNSRWAGKLTFHGVLPTTAVQELYASCDIALNCQILSDPISTVTFPSKLFSYFSADLTVISSRASDVDKIFGSACHYYDRDEPAALAEAMRAAIQDLESFKNMLATNNAKQYFSLEATADRIAKFLSPLLGKTVIQ
jgi:glycosyltransferase involved in cell wall biosynthesis